MIKIDMEMPRYCDECPCADKSWRLCKAKKNGKATITNKNMDDEKPIWCPLIECEDEKSCDTCKYQWIGNSKHCNRCEDFSEWEHK